MPRKKETRGRKRVLTPKQAKRSHQDQVNRYSKKAVTAITFKFMNSNDSDVIEQIQKQTNKADYIRQLVRRDIETNKK